MLDKIIFKTLKDMDGEYRLDAYNKMSQVPLDIHGFIVYVGKYEIAKTLGDTIDEQCIAIANYIASTVAPEVSEKRHSGCCGGGTVR